MERVSTDDRLWWLVDHERLLWIGAVVLYGIGDTTTTLWGLSQTNVAEIGPLVGPLIDRYGLSGLFIAKLGSFLGFGLFWYVLWKPTRVAVPLALLLVGGVVTAWNLLSIYTA